MKKKIALACSLCKMRNYRTNKSQAQRLEIKKYCKRCSAKTLHQEEP